MTLLDRHAFIVAGTAVVTALGIDTAAGPSADRFGLIGKLSALPGRRDALAALIADGGAAMPGCLSYIVALDAEDTNGIWITEV